MGDSGARVPAQAIAALHNDANTSGAAVQFVAIDPDINWIREVKSLPPQFVVGVTLPFLCFNMSAPRHIVLIMYLLFLLYRSNSLHQMLSLLSSCIWTWTLWVRSRQ